MKRFFFLILVLFATMMATLRPAQAQVSEDTYYLLQARHSDKVLDVSGVSRKKGAVLHQWERLNTDNQLFAFEAAGDGYYFIRAKHSGLYFSVRRLSTKNGARLQQWTKSGRSNQQFKLVPAGDGYFFLVARHSGKVLDVSGISRENGAYIHQWDNLDADNQKFKLIPMSGGQNTPSFIVGGQDVDAAPLIDTNAPWQARLSIRTSSGTYLCGGSLIERNLVVTAAHCLVGNGDIKKITVYLGDKDIRKTDGGEQTFTVPFWWIHGGYDASNNDHDIALLQLSGKATLNDKVQTIALYRVSNSTHLVGTNAVISGWGRTSGSNANSSAKILQVAQVPIIDSSDCSAEWHQLCAGTPRGGVDSCQGDSGGPLAIKVGDEYQLAGITSHGPSACNGAGTYTRVASYASWIDRWIPMVKFTVRNDGAFVASFEVTVDHAESGILDSAYLTQLLAGQSETYWVSQNDTITVTAHFATLTGWSKIKTIRNIRYSSSALAKTYHTTGTVFDADLSAR